MPNCLLVNLVALDRPGEVHYLDVSIAYITFKCLADSNSSGQFC